MQVRGPILMLLVALGGAIAAPSAQAGRAVLPPGHAHRRVCTDVRPGIAHCDAELVTTDAGTPLVTAAPNGYGPGDLRSAYGLAAAPAGAGTGQTVAVVDAYDDPTAEADLATYRARFGLPSCTTANGCFHKVDQNGGTSYPATDASWAQEMALDLDMVSAVCPNCHILLVEAASTRMSDLAAAVDRAATMGATQISNSYGGPEYSRETQSESSYDHPGVGITVSSGDDGYGVEFPASSRYVTAVGGTSLTRSGATPRGWSEQAWSGAGSGCSAYVTKPAQQTDTGCARRSVTDVAAVADPNTGVAVYDSTPYQSSSGWMVFGGTSAAAPIVAGIEALVGSTAASPAFPYANAAAFNDVTQGSNGTCAAAYLCAATAGYDGPTGVGTPSGRIFGMPVATTAAADGITQAAATLHATVDPNGQPTTYRFEYGPSTAYGSSAPAAGTSAGSAAGAVAVSVGISGLAAGTTYHYRVVAQSAAGTAQGQDLTFTTAGAPGADTGTATSVGPSAATLTGAAMANGLSTSYSFEYGTTSAYGQRTPPVDAGAGPAPVTAGAQVAGLAPATTYHYRLVAVNAAGATAGADQTFTTASPPADPTTASSVLPTSPLSSPAPLRTGTTLPRSGGAAATPPAVLTVRRTQRRTVLLRHGLRAVVACTGRCPVHATLLVGRAVAGRAAATGTSRSPARMVIRLSRAGRRLLRAHRSPRLTLRVAVTDAAGHRRIVERTLRLRP